MVLVIGSLGCPIAEGGTETMHGQVSMAHLAQDRDEGFAIDRSPRLSAGEYEGVSIDLGRLHRFEDGNGTRGERNTMFLTGFHPIGRNDPKPILKIELPPRGIEQFGTSS